MTTLRKNILIGLAVLAIGSAGAQAQAQVHAPAQAQDSRPAGTAMSKEQRHARHAERAAARQQKLREQLKLTPSQDAAFATYIAARKTAHQGRKMDRAAWQAMPAPARMEMRLERSKARLAAMETRLVALKSFYAVLTPEQQKLFDEQGARRGWGHRGHRGHGMGHGGHMMNG